MSRRKKRRVLRGRQLAAIVASSPIVYLFRDDFITDDAAPVADPLLASHVGSWDVILDTSNGLDVADGVLQLSSSVVGGEDPRLSSSVSFARTAGLALFVRALKPVTTDYDSRFGFDDANSGTVLGSGGFEFRDISGMKMWPVNISDVVLTDGVSYDCVVILRAAGVFWFIKGGMQYPSWTLLFVSGTDADDPVWIGISNSTDGTRGIDLSTVRLTQLGGVWLEDFGWVTSRLAGARSAGDTFTHAADAFIEFIETTVPSALQTELWFRIQDTSNYWAVTIDSTGALDLDEVVAGGPTQRGTAAGVISNGERVRARAIGEEIRVYDSTLRITYSSAANFKTETDGELDTEGTDGAVSDIVAWPETSQHFDKYFEGA